MVKELLDSIWRTLAIRNTWRAIKILEARWAITSTNRMPCKLSRARDKGVGFHETDPDSFQLARGRASRFHSVLRLRAAVH